MKIKRTEEKLMQIKKAPEQSIKVKNQSIKQITAVGAKVATDQMEGGEELKNAAMTAYLISKPTSDATKHGAAYAKKRIRQEQDKRIKRKEKQVSKKQDEDRRDARTEERRQEDKRQSSEKSNAKRSKNSSDKNESSSGKKDKRKIGIRGLISKTQMVLLMKPNNNQDNENKTSRWEMLLVQKVAVPVLVFLLIVMVLCALVAIPVLAVITLIYNSPFALFFPTPEGGESVQSVTSAYIAEFNQEVNELMNTHDGYDTGCIVYVDYEGTNENPSNLYDIMAVYMVEYGMGESATVINDISKGWIATVVDDMCDYSTSSGTEVIVHEDGTETTQTVLYVNVTLKDYQDMISIYDLDETQSELLDIMMSPDSLAMLGHSEGIENGQSSISRAEVNQILSEITNDMQRQTCNYVLSKVGYPYSQAYRDSGDYYDCSSLAYYSWKSAGVDISHGGATTAAAEAQGLEEAGKNVPYEELQPGDLIFYSYCQNGRYKNISHVAIYMGNGKVVEAKNESAGVVYGDIPNPERIVLIGRPQ